MHEEQDVPHAVAAAWSQLWELQRVLRLGVQERWKRSGLGGVSSARRCFPRDLLGGQSTFPKASNPSASFLRRPDTRHLDTRSVCAGGAQNHATTLLKKQGRPAAERCDGCRPAFCVRAPHAIEMQPDKNRLHQQASNVSWNAQPMALSTRLGKKLFCLSACRFPSVPNADYFLPASFGFSVISASLVSSKVATLAAFSKPTRTTFVGSITPALTRSSKVSVAAL